MKRLNISFVFVLGASLASVSYSTKLFVSPVYIFGPLIAAIYFLKSLASKELRLKQIVFVPATFLIASVALFSWTSQANFSVNLIIGLSLFIIIINEGPRLHKTEVEKVLSIYILYTLSITSIDTVWRLLNPGVPESSLASADAYTDSDMWFYMYKFNSTMFLDSNTVALVIVPLLVLQLQRIRSEGKGGWLVFLIIAIGVASCFSRSAILAGFIVMMYLLFGSYRFVLAVISCLAYLQFTDYQDVLGDKSLLTKVSILDRVRDYLSNANILDIALGNGFGNGEAAIGKFPHIIFVEYLVGGGVIGLGFLLVFCVYVVYRLGKYPTAILATGLICGLSYYLYAGTPFLFVPIALSYVYENRVRCRVER